MSIKLISLNIEGNKHLKEKVLPFLKMEDPDVICLQEVFKNNVKSIKKSLKMTGFFVPMGLVNYKLSNNCSFNDEWGLLVLTKLSIDNSGYKYYCGNSDNLPIFYFGVDPNIVNRAVAWIQVSNQKQSFTIVTTHFVWSFAGSISTEQTQALVRLYDSLSQFHDCVLIGDFNTPRGKEIYSDLSSRYEDNIPSQITTTIDNQYHRSKDHIEFVVDGVFSSSKYKVSQVSIVDGLSDHCAIVCIVSQQSYIGRIKANLRIIKKRTLFCFRKNFNLLKL